MYSRSLYEPVHRRGHRGFALAALCVGLLTGCSGNSETSFTFLNTPANGRPETCPDDAIDPGGPGGGPMAPRCSYDDAAASMVQLRGSVLLEAGGAGEIARPAEGMRVTVERSGDQVGKTVSDAQGGFTVSLATGPGTYVLRVVAEETGEVLAERTAIVPEGASGVSGLDLLLPLDPALRSP